MTQDPIRVGVIGCGTISKIYLENAPKFGILQVVACADLLLERAEARATEFAIPRAYSVDKLLADPDVDLVINLTIPAAHAEVATAAIAAAKSVYNEKPLAVDRVRAVAMLREAGKRRVRVGCAPDTFLGGGLQTCRKLVDDGAIGMPVAATAFMLSHGHESWHPDPTFYYQPGGGPMFDMGPYYLTALVSLIGPVRRVFGSTRVTFSERTITSQPKAGTKITVNTPTHIAGILDFANGAIGTIVTTFDVWPTDLPRIEIYGTEGSLSVPDPNTFGGPVRLRRPGAREWEDVPLTHGNVVNSRGIGPADLALAIRSNRPHRASGELAFHVLDV
ncbi:MAG TPA: Gfo/Idh/MocA family oxidoreductase, partial [Chloroflexota bacterium]|nr:Gfo/Idh/MocA family oxidoreductase [Chloroflexota bacterium]